MRWTVYIAGKRIAEIETESSSPVVAYVRFIHKEIGIQLLPYDGRPSQSDVARVIEQMREDRCMMVSHG